MRWDHLRARQVGDGMAEPTGQEHGQAALPLPESLMTTGARVRRFAEPEFRGVTCYEINARSIINRVPAASAVPFRWTINAYRGCTHACVYCFARKTHTYLDFDAGRDFDSQIVVKVNAARLLGRELGARNWSGEPIAMGTNVDPYQRVEGRYQLTRALVEQLVYRRNPFSVLTKATLVTRDLELLAEGARHTRVGVNFSVGFVDENAWRAVEPGTPRPAARLRACRAAAEAGIRPGVLMAPILPFLTDDDDALEATVAAIAAAGAAWVAPMVLHLRPGAREWFSRWLSREHPELVGRYANLYQGGAYAPRSYSEAVCRKVDVFARQYGLTKTAQRDASTVDQTEQLRFL